MENNNTPRKARIYYKGESIPVLVEGESFASYELRMDWESLVQEVGNGGEAAHKRDLYLDAVFGWEGAHTVHDDVIASETHLDLYKNYEGATLVFDKPEPEEAQAEPTEKTEPDNVVPFPKVVALTELEQHLTLLARSGYKVKSFDVSIQEGKEAHLCATLTKEVDN